MYVEGVSSWSTRSPASRHFSTCVGCIWKVAENKFLAKAVTICRLAQFGKCLRQQILWESDRERNRSSSAHDIHHTNVILALRRVDIIFLVSMVVVAVTLMVMWECHSVQYRPKFGDTFSIHLFLVIRTNCQTTPLPRLGSRGKRWDTLLCSLGGEGVS